MSPQLAGAVIRFGVFELDLSAAELRKQGRKVNLQQQPFQVLALLVQRPGELVTREELQQSLSRFIETLPRKGYRFIAPVSGAKADTEKPARDKILAGRMWRIAAALIVAVAAGAAGWVLRQPGERTDALLVPVPLTTDPGAERQASFSPDGNRVVFDWQPDRGISEVRVKRIGESESRILAEGCCPAWSPGRPFHRFPWRGWRVRGVTFGRSASKIGRCAAYCGS